MLDFSKRASGTEKMDDLGVTGPGLFQALRELDTINRLLGGNYVTLDGLLQILRKAPGQILHIADLGCGSGDMLKRIRRLLRDLNRNAALTGIDANPNVIRFAAEHTAVDYHITYETLSIFSAEFQSRRFDVVTATLFFHHFTDEELVTFFRSLKAQVRIGMIINDIHRHWFAYYSIKWITAAFSHSGMVKNDAPLSVMRAFRRQELAAILTKAGIADFRIKWRWAFRWQVVVFL